MDLNYYNKEKYQRLRLAVTLVVSTLILITALPVDDFFIYELICGWKCNEDESFFLFLIYFIVPFSIYTLITVIYWVLDSFKEEFQDLNKVTTKELPLLNPPQNSEKEEPIYILYVHRTHHIDYNALNIDCNNLSINSFTLNDNNSEILLKDRLATFKNKDPILIKTVIKEGLNLESINIKRHLETALNTKLLEDKISEDQKNLLFFNFVDNDTEIVLNDNFNLKEIDICVHSLIKTGNYKIKKPFSWVYLTLETSYLNS